MALLAQVALNTAPLWLSAQSADPAAAGAYVTAASYLRIPVLLAGGVFAVSLATLSAAHGRGDAPGVRALVRRWAGGSVLMTAVACAVLLVLSGPLLHLLYGSSTGLPAGVLVVLALTTVAAVAAGLLTLVLYAVQRAPAAVAVWAVAAVVATGLLALAHGEVLPVALAVLAGQAVAVIGVLVPLVPSLQGGRPA